MFQVAICDDNSIFVSDFVKQLNTILKSLNIDYKIDCFLSICEFIQEKTEREYHLLFLDIEFPDKERKSVFYEKGIELGKRLRERVQCNHLLIDFISAKTEYGMQLFEF